MVKTTEISVDMSTVGGSPSKGYTLQSLLTGGSHTYAVDYSSVTKQSVPLSINYELPSDLALLGSVYTRFAIAVDVVRENWPRGFAFTASSVTDLGDTVQIEFNHEDSILSELWDFSDGTVTSSYELVAYFDGVRTGTALTFLALTASTSSTIYSASNSQGLNFAPGPVFSFAVVPTLTSIANFQAKHPYERLLIEGSPTKTNTWPTHATYTDLLVYDGSEYDTFIDTEVAIAVESDSIGYLNKKSDVLWDLIPEPMKSLDSQSLMRNLVNTYGAIFDKIRLYQEHLAYAHTVGYDSYHHVPRSLILEVADLLGWKGLHDSSLSTLSEYYLPVVDHYTLSNKLSLEDLAFERLRRLLSNLIFIWKAKGTRVAIERVLSAYGIPAALLELNEYVEKLESSSFPFNRMKVIGGVYLVTGSTSSRTYYDSDGSEYTTNYPIYNSRQLDVNISESNAIELDVYAQRGNLVFRDINGTVSSLASKGVNHSGLDYNTWVEVITNLAIPSDGSARYSRGYTLLSGIYSAYLNTASTPYVRGTFSGLIDFLEDSYSELVTQLIPASSKLLGQGTLYRNLEYHAQKYVWIRKSIVDQPFNEEISWNIGQISGRKMASNSVELNVVSTSGKSMAKPSTIVSVADLTAYKPTSTSSEINVGWLLATVPTKVAASILSIPVSSEFLPLLEDSDFLELDPTGVVNYVDSPVAIAISENSGSSIFTAFTPSCLIVTNDNKFNVSLSASNLSSSGFTRITVELFNRVTPDDVASIEGKEYTVLSTLYEGGDYSSSSNNIGTYRVSSVNGLSVGDTLLVRSDYGAYINQYVTIVGLYNNQDGSHRNLISVAPPIGLDNLPVGKNASAVALKSLLNSEVPNYIINARNTPGITYDILAAYVGYLFDSVTETGKRTLNDFANIQEFAVSLATKNSIPIENMQALHPFNFLPKSQLAACAVLIPFVKEYGNTFSLETDRVSIYNELLNKIASVSLYKVAEYFDWSSPIQRIEITNDDPNGWVLPTESSWIKNNTYTTTGSVTVGGLNELNANLLVDKREYFLRWSVDTHIPSGMTGETYFDVVSGSSVIRSSYNNESVINGLYYYGNYFAYMTRPKEPTLITYPTSSSQTDSAAVTIGFDGVGDADILEVQLIEDGPATGSPVSAQITSSYSSFTEDNWSSAITIQIQVKRGADDKTLYTLQASLEPSTWHWWRLKNSKTVDSMFGYTIKSSSYTKPLLFATGDFLGFVSNEGTNTNNPEPPSGEGGKTGLIFN